MSLLAPKTKFNNSNITFGGATDGASANPAAAGATPAGTPAGALATPAASGATPAGTIATSTNPTGATATPTGIQETDEDKRLKREKTNLDLEKAKSDKIERQNERELKTMINISQNPDDLKKISELINDIKDKETKISLNTEMQNKLNKIKEETTNKSITRFNIPVSEAKIQEALPLILGDDTLNSSFDDRINNMRDKLKSIQLDTEMKQKVLENKNIEQIAKDKLTQNIKQLPSSEKFIKDFNEILKSIFDFMSSLNIFGEKGKPENWKYMTLLLLFPSYILSADGLNIINFLVSNFIIIICILYALFKFNDSENKFFSDTFTVIAYPILVFILSLLKNIGMLDDKLSFSGDKLIFLGILTTIIFINLVVLFNTNSFPIIQFIIYILLNIFYLIDFNVNNKKFTKYNLPWIVALPGLLITLGQDNIVSTITSVLFLAIITCELFTNDIKNLILK